MYGNVESAEKSANSSDGLSFVKWIFLWDFIDVLIFVESKHLIGLLDIISFLFMGDLKGLETVSLLSYGLIFCDDSFWY